MLTISNLTVSVDDKAILKGLNLSVPKGEVHAIMGPNGAGKSTLGYALAGRDGYTISADKLSWDGEDLRDLEPHERAAKGLFLSLQYPVEIPGVAALTFLRTSVNAQRRARGQEELSAPEFMKRAREAAATLKIPDEMLKRPLNVGFSGGEKKRMEALQILLLQPTLIVLDETDSGLDIDALKLIGETINALRGPDKALVVITHYPRLLDYIRPDRVHVLQGGQIVTSGDAKLALALEADGYDSVVANA